MRKFPIIVATAALILGAPLAAQAGTECLVGQGHRYRLDFEIGSKGQALISLALRTVADECVDGSTTYELVGFPRTYDSMSQAKMAFEYVMALKGYGFTDAADFAKAVAYANKIEAARKAAEATANKR